MKKTIIDKSYFVDYIKSQLVYLQKDELIEIYIEVNGEEEISKRSKETIIRKIQECDFNYEKVYDKYCTKHFGLHPSKVEEILNIDKNMRKKLERLGFLRVVYKKEAKMYGKYIGVPYYDLKNLMITSTDEIKKVIKDNTKELTEKQLAAIEKSKQTRLKNRTCKICGNVVSNKRELEDGKCEYCVAKEKGIKEFSKFLDNRDEYVILDTETTGLNTYNDKIIEIGIIDMEGKTLLDTLVFTDKEISKEASIVNGITNDKLEGKPRFEELIDKIDEIIKDKTVLIYNESFDGEMLYRNGYKKPFKSKCIMMMYMRYANEKRYVSLQNAMYYEGLNIIQEHGAIGDCKCVLELIKSIVS